MHLLRPGALKWITGGVFAGMARIALASQLERLAPPPNLPGLPGPGPVEKWIFEQPVLAMVFIGVLGATGWWLAKKQAKDTLGHIIAIVAAVGVLGVFLIAQRVQTPREQLLAATQAFVEAVAADDQDVLDAMLDDHAMLSTTRAFAAMDRQALLSWIDRYLSQDSPYAVAGASTSQLQAAIGTSSLTARSRVTVRVTMASTNADVPSHTVLVCMLSWRKGSASDAPWQVTDIEPLWLQDWGEIRSEDMERPQTTRQAG